MARIFPYKVYEVIADGLLAINSGLYGLQWWSRGKTRKQHRCENCLQEYLKGTLMYRPIGNDSNRMERLCVKCMEK